jgi:hypothetical protein
MPEHRTLQGQLNALPAGTLPAPDAGVALQLGHRREPRAVPGRDGAPHRRHDGPSTSPRAEAALLDSLDDSVPQAVVDRSIAYGDALATAILSLGRDGRHGAAGRLPDELGSDRSASGRRLDLAQQSADATAAALLG